MQDIRTDFLIPKTLRIEIDMQVVFEKEPKGLMVNLGDELAVMLTKRLSETVGITHLRTDTWDISLS